ncbi:nuclear pore complex protein Nup93-like [Cimex lectularius]|uniref:Nuclear pore protein n=1 Tax=Cimex lectularius TaxID=79782 RepID=A0A8I6SBX1_CIMLE|nr:nuclear pore complex protein Nup93-like [Cimex lectularius]
MAEPDFSDLVFEAEQLATELEGADEFPKIERSLKQVLEASQTLWSRVSATGAQDIQANLLLGTKGLDLPQVTQKLETLSTRRTFEPLEPVPTTDIQNYLKNESENAILQLIESTHFSTFNYISRLHASKISDEWNQHKNNLMNSLLGYSKEIIDIPMRKERTVINESLFGLQSSLDQTEMAYAKCLMDYNNAQLQGLPKVNLLESFQKAASVQDNPKLNEMWKMLSFMTQLPPQGKGDPLVARAQPQVQECMVEQALNYLEQRYKEYMNMVVSGNMGTAKRGGVPGTYPLVRGFLSVKNIGSELGLEETYIDGLPLWPLVYYCLRCGDIGAAFQCVQQAGPSKKDMVMVLLDLKDSPQRRLSTQAEMEVRCNYRRVVRSSTDPYKRAVYCLLGACDVNDDHKSLVKTADDYLWMKLWQLREEEPEPVPDRLYYSLLQTLVLEEYGEQYYKAGEQPHLFFQMLVLTGQWESAIDFLIRVDKYRAHAVHMAIAIHELNLLALPASMNSPLLVIDESDKVPMRRLNLLRLILLYTRKFESSDPKETLHYYYTLRNFPGLDDDRDAFSSCVINLVIETKEYKTILGYLEVDGTRHSGLLDKFETGHINVRTIIESVASTAESRGLIEDAISLYDLSENHEKVLSLLNSMLSQVLSSPSSDKTSQRARLVQMAEKIEARYRNLTVKCKASTLTTFIILHQLIQFFDMYRFKEYNKALDIIHACKIIPTSEDEMEDRINNFRVLEDSISRNISDILLATMHIYHWQYQQTIGELKKGTGPKLEDINQSKQLNFIREKARLLTSFAGTIPYRMPGDTNSRLVQLEIRMN